MISIFQRSPMSGTTVGKPGAYTFEPVSDELAEHTREKLKEVYDSAFAAYEELIEAGVAREVAQASCSRSAPTHSSTGP